MHISLRSKRFFYALLSSLLLIGSSPALATSAKISAIEIEADNPPVTAGATKTIYYYQLTNILGRDFEFLSGVADKYLPQHITRAAFGITEINELAKSKPKFFKDATECQFYPKTAGLKSNKSCLVKYNIDATGTAKGDKIRVDTLEAIGQSSDGRQYPVAFSKTPVTVDTSAGNLNFKAESLQKGNKWFLNDDGQKYTLTVINEDSDETSEVRDITIDLKTWNSEKLEKFRKYFGETVPQASAGCGLVVHGGEDCKFTFRKADATGKNFAKAEFPLSAEIVFNSSNAQSKPLTMIVKASAGRIHFTAEGDLVEDDKLNLKDDGQKYTLNVINDGDEDSEVQNVTIDSDTWNSDELKELRKYFGEKAPEPSLGCALIDTKDVDCHFIFKANKEVVGNLVEPLTARIAFNSSNSEQKFLNITVAKNEPTLGFQDTGVGITEWALDNDGKTYVLTVTNSAKATVTDDGILKDVAIDAEVWNSDALSNFRKYFGKEVPAPSEKCASVAPGSTDCKFNFAKATGAEKIDKTAFPLHAKLTFKPNNDPKKPSKSLEMKVYQTPLELHEINSAGVDTLIADNNWKITNDKDSYKLFVIQNNTLALHATDTVKDIKINKGHWEQTSANFRKFFGEIPPVASANDECINTTSAPDGCVFTFTKIAGAAAMLPTDFPLNEKIWINSSVGPKFLQLKVTAAAVPGPIK